MTRTIPRTASILFLITASVVTTARARQGGSAQFVHGQTTFTQGGREVTWILWQGTLRDVTTPRPMTQANFIFTPDGKPGPEEGGSLLRLSVAKSGETYLLQALAVENGPGGSGLASYREGHGKCVTTVSRFEERSVGGSIACTGTFEGGAAVTKLYFSARP